MMDWFGVSTRKGLQTPQVVDTRLKNEEKIRRTIVLTYALFFVSCVPVYFVCDKFLLYRFTKSYFFGGLVFLTAYVIKTRYLKKDYQSEVPQIPKRKILGLDGFVKKESNHGLISKSVPKTVIVSHENSSKVSLPDDMLPLIFLNLNVRDLCRVSQSCKKYYKILNSSSFLKLLIEKNFGIVFSGDNSKEEYRLLASWKHLIFTRYRCTFNAKESIFFTPFQGKSIKIKDNCIERADGSVIENRLDTALSLEHMQFTESMLITTPRRGVVAGYDNELNCRFQHVIPRYRAFNFGFLVQALEIHTYVFFSLLESFCVYDKRTHQTKEILSAQNLVIEKMTSLNGQLVILTALNNVQSLVFYSPESNLELKENRKVLVTNVNTINSVTEEDNPYLIVVHVLASGHEILGYAAHDLEKPSFILSLPPDASSPKVFEKYVLFTKETHVEIWNMFQLEQQMTVDFVFDVDGFYNPLSSFRHFLVLANHHKIVIVDFKNLKEVFTVSSSSEMAGIQIINGRLVIYSKEHSQREPLKIIDLYDFGNFEKV